MKIINSLYKKIADFYKTIDVNNVISFKNCQDDYVELSYLKKTIYGLKIENPSNLPNEINYKYLIEKMRVISGAEILINIIKNEREYNTYIYTNKKEMVGTIKTALQAKQMNCYEIVKSFGDYFFFNKYDIKDNQLIDYLENDVKQIGCNELLFNYIANLRSYEVLQKNDVYVISGIRNKLEINGLELLSKKWKGVLSILLSSNTSIKESLFQRKLEYYKSFDNEMYKNYYYIEKNKEIKGELLENTILISGFYLGNDEDMPIIEDTTGLNLVKNIYDGDKIYRQTLLKYRQDVYSFLMPKEKFEKIFRSSKKEIKKAHFENPESWSIPDFWGEDICQGFINHTFVKNSNPHCIIVGETGSGKTTGVQKIITDAMGFDEELNSEIFEKGLVALRWFDVDYSSGGLINALRKKYPEKCRIISQNVKDLKFNILDINQQKNSISNLDKNIIISFMNMILKLNGNDSFTSTEISILGKELDFIFSKEYETINYSLEEIENFEGYENLVQSLYEKGFNKYDKILNLPKEYDFLKSPTLKDVIYSLSLKKNNANISALYKQSMESLISKLESLSQLGIFDFKSNVNWNEDKEIFYIDVTQIRRSKPLFVSIVFLLLMDLINKDKIIKTQLVESGKPKRKVFYVIEEAHNFLNVKEFADVFADFTKELRKYNIHLIFLIHNLKSIGLEYYKSIATKMFFFKEGTRNIVLNEIKDFEKTFEKEKEEVYFLTGKIERGIFMIHSEGVDGFRQIIPKKMFNYFKQEVVK